MKEWEDEPDEEVAAMIKQAWLYRKMADDLRAQAAQLKYRRSHPAKTVDASACA